MQLYFVRHGQTDWNAQDLIQGWTDIPLNGAGIEQAEALRDVIRERGLKFDAIYTSPLQRTAQTAQIITGGQRYIVYDERLKERNVGEFEGKPSGSLFNHEIDFLDPVLNAGDFGVEPIRDFQNRIKNFLHSLKQQHPDDAKILCVTSNGFMKRLAKLTGQQEIPNFRNGDIFEYKF